MDPTISAAAIKYIFPPPKWPNAKDNENTIIATAIVRATKPSIFFRLQQVVPRSDDGSDDGKPKHDRQLDI